MREYSDIVTRQGLAYQNLIDILQQYGAGEFASDVADLYLKERIVTLNARTGQCKFKHGAFLESDVIKRAISAVQAS